MIIAILCLLVVTAIASWLFEKHSLRRMALFPVTLEKTAEELNFQQALDDNRTGLLSATDTTTALPLVLNDTIWIRRDTLRLDGKGMRFLKSPDYSGAAFAIADSCNYVLLENMTFENFDVGVVVPNKSLHLKNVRFIGCRVPVQAQVSFPENKSVSGAVSNFFVADSLHH